MSQLTYLNNALIVILLIIFFIPLLPQISIIRLNRIIIIISYFATVVYRLYHGADVYE